MAVWPVRAGASAATLVTPEPAPDPVRSGSPSRPSAWLLVSLLVAALGTAVAAYANIDPDIYWHRLLGQLWLDQRSLGIGIDPIAYTDAARDWFPTAWLAEVGYALIVGAFGYQGLVALRFVLVLAFYALFGRFLHQHYPAWAAAATLCVVGLPASLVLQDRPQTISLVLCAASLPALRRWLTDDRLPSALVALPLAWCWANLHGLWILVPALYFLAGAIRLLERTVDWRPFAVGAGCLAAGAVTPVGPKLLLAPLLVTSSTAEINEWQRTALYSPVAWGLAGALLILLAAWSRPRVRVERRALVFAVVVTAFGLMAFRNAVVASVLLAPLVAAALTAALPSVRTTATVPRPLLLATAMAAVVSLGFVYAAQPATPEYLPTRIAAHLKAENTDLRVVSPYNLSGFLREFGGDRVRLAIDGRADRYGNTTIRRHNSLLDGKAGWERRLARLKPDVVVVRRSSALRQLLLGSGWRRVVVDGDYVLLEPTSATTP
jgi:hypothetical protein